MTTGEDIEQRVDHAVAAWLLRLPEWRPGTQRVRARLCRRCTGSPILAAAGITDGVPHQVGHGLVSRMQRIIDRRVDEFTAEQLPALHSELSEAALWESGGFDPAAGLDPEYDGIDLDPEVDEPTQPFLFTLAGLAEETKPEPPLPRPPLSPEEKRRIRMEIDLADRCAAEAGRQVCFALAEHRPRIQAAIRRFVEPQIEALLAELSRHLEPPS
ncbi:spermidine/putrescine ABC transporter substrate-binding protein [Leucobacter sp. GX24907]